MLPPHACPARNQPAGSLSTGPGGTPGSSPSGSAAAAHGPAVPPPRRGPRSHVSRPRRRRAAAGAVVVARPVVPADGEGRDRIVRPAAVRCPLARGRFRNARRAGPVPQREAGRAPRQGARTGARPVTAPCLTWINRRCGGRPASSAARHHSRSRRPKALGLLDAEGPAYGGRTRSRSADRHSTPVCAGRGATAGPTEPASAIGTSVCVPCSRPGPGMAPPSRARAPALPGSVPAPGSSPGDFGRAPVACRGRSAGSRRARSFSVWRPGYTARVRPRSTRARAHTSQ